MAFIEKLKNFKLGNIFKRAAQPSFPPEMLENKALRKAIVKHHRKKVRRRIKYAFLASATLSTALQFAPNLVSTPFDTYMAGKGYPADLSQNYHTKEIRVYERSNVLYPFHMAGRETGMLWHENLKEKHISLIGLVISTPIVYTTGIFKGFMDMLPGDALDAYSMSSNDAPSQRVNFIRPPGEFSVPGFLSDFSNIEAKNFKFQHSQEDIQKTLFEFVMLHEARHGDQQKLSYITANESDADLYAFRVMASRGTDPGLLQEAVTIVAHARSMNATLYGDQSHVSTFALLRGSQRIFDAHEDAAAFRRLHELLAEADKFNDKAFPDSMAMGTRYFYLTAALDRVGLLDEDPGLKRAAGAFVGSIAYFNNVSGGTMLDPKFSTTLNLGYLAGNYVPVPDRLPAPVKPPKPSS